MEAYFKEIEMAITVCDEKGEILAMNEKACATFGKNGGEKLIGKSLFGCHPKAANEMIQQMLSQPEANIYSIEKEGRKKMIYQLPWYENQVFKGYIEFSMTLPENIVHKVRS